MEQIWVGGRPQATVVNNATYPLTGAVTLSSNNGQMVSGYGVIKELRVLYDQAPTGVKTYTMTVDLNGSPTALSCTTTGNDTAGADMKTRVKVKPGDYVALRHTTTGTPTAPTAIWSTVFESQYPKHSLMACGSNSLIIVAGTRYSDLSGGDTWSTLRAARTNVVSASGVIRNLYILLTVAPGVGNTHTFTVWKNGIATSLSVAITGVAVSGNDCTDADAVSVVPGDQICITCVTLNTPVQANAMWGCLFIAKKDGISLLMGNTMNNSTDGNGTTWYYTINTGGGSVAQQAADTTARKRTIRCRLTDLYVCSGAAAGAGKAWALTLRRNGASELLSAQMANPAITANDTTNMTECYKDDTLDMMIVNTGNIGAGTYASWGLKMYVEPKRNLYTPEYRTDHMDNGLGLKRHPRSRAY